MDTCVKAQRPRAPRGREFQEISTSRYIGARLYRSKVHKMQILALLPAIYRVYKKYTESSRDFHCHLSRGRLGRRRRRFARSRFPCHRCPGWSTARSTSRSFPRWRSPSGRRWTGPLRPPRVRSTLLHVDSTEAEQASRLLRGVQNLSRGCTRLRLGRAATTARTTVTGLHVPY